MSRCLEEKEILDNFATMHLMCIKLETLSEKITRYLLEKWGYIDAARARLGGEYATLTSPEKIKELKDYYEDSIR